MWPSQKSWTSQVQIFWEGQKIEKKILRLVFTYLSNVKSKLKFFFSKFGGLLTIYELYLALHAPQLTKFKNKYQLCLPCDNLKKLISKYIMYLLYCIWVIELLNRKAVKVGLISDVLTLVTLPKKGCQISPLSRKFELVVYWKGQEIQTFCSGLIFGTFCWQWNQSQNTFWD